MRSRRKNKKYSHEYKLEAVRMVDSSDRPISKIAEELGVPTTTLEGWIAKFSARSPQPAEEPAQPTKALTESEELVRLRRENERLRMERDFLKKAAAFFANENK